MNRSALALALSVSTFAATMFAAGLASATTCTTDADCGGAGFTCVKDETVQSCNAGSECPAPTVSPTGTCASGTITCTADTDCPSFESCQAVNDGVGEASPPCGPNDHCADPPPSTPPSTTMQCAAKQTTCVIDADCGAGFECIAEPSSDCATPACANSDGTPCTVPDPSPCQPSTANQSFCQVKQINCQADADCPTSWKCFDYTESECAGSTGSGNASSGSSSASSGGAPTPTPTPGSAPQDDPPSGCTSSTVSVCTPPGLNGGGLAEAGVANDGSTSTKDGSTPPTATFGTGGGAAATDAGANADGAAPSDSDSGCSTSTGSSGFFGGLLIALGAVMARRKR